MILGGHENSLSGRPGAPEIAEGVDPAAKVVVTEPVAAEGALDTIWVSGTAVGLVDSSDTEGAGREEAPLDAAVTAALLADEPEAAEVELALAEAAEDEDVVAWRAWNRWLLLWPRARAGRAAMERVVSRNIGGEGSEQRATGRDVEKQRQEATPNSAGEPSPTRFRQPFLTVTMARLAPSPPAASGPWFVFFRATTSTQSSSI